MIIGHHILYGKEMELDQPVVAVTKDNSQGIYTLQQSIENYSCHKSLGLTAALSQG